MSLTQIRSRIQALQRRYALPLAVIRLRPYATQFCHQWAVAQDQQQPLPETPAFIRKLADAGFRLTTFMYLHHHFERHLSNNTCPNPKGIISALLPHAAAREGIIDAVFRWDPYPTCMRTHSRRMPALLRPNIPLQHCARGDPTKAVTHLIRPHDIFRLPWIGGGRTIADNHLQAQGAGPRANQIHFDA